MTKKKTDKEFKALFKIRSNTERFTRKMHEMKSQFKMKNKHRPNDRYYCDLQVWFVAEATANQDEI